MFCEKPREHWTFFSGIFFILLGTFFLIFWEGIQQTLVRQKLQLSETSKTYEPWIKSQVPIYVQYYFFNWTNPSNMKGPHYKPLLEEVGPYKFWEKIEKVNVTWNENGTVTYRRMRRWYFDPTGSNGTLEDKITTINTIVLMAGRMVSSMPSLGRIPMNMMIASTQKISVTRTVSEFLYEGYADPLLTTGRQLPVISSKVPYDKFGWFYKRNGSSTFDGVYNAQTGENGMQFFGSVSFWNYKNQTGFYNGACGEVKGSAGEYWPWDRTKYSNVYLFSPDLCRELIRNRCGRMASIVIGPHAASEAYPGALVPVGVAGLYIEYRYSEDASKDGMNGYKYVAQADLFDNGTINSGNKCFCNGQCLAAGVLNISVCRFGAPVFTSFPHFYLADPVYGNAVGGMKPEKNLHENYILLEPKYGMPMEIAARFQINVLVQPNPYVALLNGVKQLVFPVLWLDQRVLVPSKRLFVIKILTKIPSVNFTFSIVLIVAGVVCLLFFVQCITSRKSKSITGKSRKGTNKKKRKSSFPLENENPFLTKKRKVVTK